ncbi:glycosyltransferase family 9 protein [Microbacterium oryzae]|uniref:Glycosyltransferase family 9 protein n=1 Tax=Microbacterium oryzae TaxID=743009 RepID=A0A6I6E2K6_9MICO|nr:glycosyltransferase family 9 protein [Microbacterium oryzae]QGU26720.1 glycosyltransferase family 9 protein [Microbacterium oryzae]
MTPDAALDTAAPALAVVAPPRERFADVRRIALLRGGGLGDLLFALPAAQALMAAYPDAEVTLLGSPIAAALLPGRAGAPHRIEVLPPIRGVGAAPGAVTDDDEIARFVAAQRERGYDLAVQLHGGGRFSNPFLLSLGATHTIGTRTDDAAELERTVDYIYYQHEMLRGLEVAGLAGAAPVALEARLGVSDEEHAAAAAISGEDRPVVVIHPGATDPRRRWPVERFAEVATAAVAEGARVVLVGDGADAHLCGEIAARIDAPEDGLVVDASGRLDLGTLAGVLARADVMLGNDSGPRHLAQAVGARTVSVFWFGNVVNAGPLGRGRHRVHLGWTTHCPTCGRDSTQVGWTAPRCEHDDSFVAGVAAADVRDDVLRLVADAVAERAAL